jgi:hypothetical protein
MFFSKKKKNSTSVAPVVPEIENYDALDNELYCRGDVISFPVGNDQSLVYSRVNRRVSILPTFTTSLLPYCNSFKSIEAHAEACIRSLRMDQQQTDFIYDSLFNLAEAGLLIPLNSVRDLQQKLEPDNEQAKITTVGFVTHNRTDSLKRAITSYIVNNKRHGRECDFVVIDSSPSPAVRTQTQDMLRALVSDNHISLSYAGFDERVNFANLLVDQFKIPRHVIDFALLGADGFKVDTGANRNGLLLHTAGELFFSADDDTTAELYEVPERIDGLTFCSEEPIEGWFFPDRATAVQSVRSVEEDLLSIHEQWLGKELIGLASIIDPDNIDYEQLNVKYLKDLTAGIGKIIAVLPGIIGDSGIGSPRWFLLSGDTRDRLCNSEEEYENAFRSREMLRAVQRINLGRVPSVMTTALGLDNRDLLPPFFPILRNQDSVFGITLVKVFDTAYFCHLPWALLHAPLESRAYTPAHTSLSCSMSDVLQYCIRAFETSFGFIPAEERMRAMGKHLMNFGVMPQSDFEEFILIRFWEQTSKLINMAEELLQSYEYSPDFWAENLETYSKALKSVLLRKESIIPFDLKEQTNTEAPLSFTQQLIYQFGELLDWWPEIVRSTKQLRSEGCRIATPVE